MKSDKLMDAITEMDEDLLVQAEKMPKKKAKVSAEKRRLLSGAEARWAVAAALTLVLLAGWMVYRKDSERIPEQSRDVVEAADPKEKTDALVQPTQGKVQTLAVPVYPSEWSREEREKQKLAGNVLADPTRIRYEAAYGAADLYRSFFADAMLMLLSEEEKQNAVMSPVSLYMALAMLAETTGSETRQEILNVLAADNIDTLRENARKIWNLCYFDDGTEKTVLGNSLWLSNRFPYQENTVKELAEEYYASVFQGDTESAEYLQMLQTWTNEMTGGLLTDETQKMEMTRDTLLELVSTVFYQSQWTECFEKKLTEEGLFHAPQGDVPAFFMHNSMSADYYTGASFVAVFKSNSQGGVWFFLPNEGVSVEDMMNDATFRDFLAYPFRYENYWDYMTPKTYRGVTGGYALIELSVPKLDLCTASQDLEDSLKKLGVSLCFDGEKSDFSPLTTVRQVWVEKAVQSSRLIMDEDGTTATSFVDISVFGGVKADEKLTLTFDRPFFLMVTGAGDIPLFAAVVNEP